MVVDITFRFSKAVGVNYAISVSNAIALIIHCLSTAQLVPVM